MMGNTMLMLPTIIWIYCYLPWELSKRLSLLWMDCLFEGMNLLLSAVRSMSQYHTIEESLVEDYVHPSRNDAWGESPERAFRCDSLRDNPTAKLAIVLVLKKHHCEQQSSMFYKKSKSNHCSSWRYDKKHSNLLLWARKRLADTMIYLYYFLTGYSSPCCSWMVCGLIYIIQNKWFSIKFLFSCNTSLLVIYFYVAWWVQPLEISNY